MRKLGELCGSLEQPVRVGKLVARAVAPQHADCLRSVRPRGAHVMVTIADHRAA